MARDFYYLLFVLFTASCASFLINETQESIPIVVLTQTLSPIVTTLSPIDTPVAPIENINTPEMPSSEISSSVINFLESPDNGYVAVVISSKLFIERSKNEISGHSWFELRVVNQNLHRNEIVDIYQNADRAWWGMPWPLSWSTNGEKLFYTNRIGGGIGCFRDEYDLFGHDLFVYDIQSLENRKLVDGGYWVALSLNQLKFAYIEDSENIISIVNLSTSEKKQIDIIQLDGFVTSENLRISNLMWSPDNGSIIYAVQNNYCNEEKELHTTTLVLVDLETETNTVLYLENEDKLLPIKWEDDNVIILEERMTDNYWNFHIDNGILEKIP